MGDDPCTDCGIFSCGVVNDHHSTSSSRPRMRKVPLSPLTWKGEQGHLANRLSGAARCLDA